MKKILAINGGKKVRRKKFPSYNTIGKEEKRAVLKVLNSGVLSQYLGVWGKDFYGGEEVRTLEKEWAAHFHVKHAIAVNSATSGLFAATGAIGIGPGDEVIVSPYTMSASVMPPLIYGAVPVFADIEQEYFCLDPASVEQRITERTKAIIVVDLFGQPYDVERINKIAKKHNLILIEDASQAPGAAYQGKFAGTLGDIGIFSLNYHKHIHTGEGGMVVTDNDELADRVRLIRNHAESIVEAKGVKNLTNMVGFNFRMTEIEAAIARCQLKKLKSLLKSRINDIEYLTKRLETIEGLRPPRVRPGCTHSFYVHPILYDQRVTGVPRDRFIDAVKAELTPTRGRESWGPLISCGYVKPLYLLPLFQKRIAIGANGYPFTAPLYYGNVTYKKGICPVVEQLYEYSLFYHDLAKPPVTKKDLDDIAKAFVKVSRHVKELR
ncbi:DegT/DnrJ/EryC1/StrS family aminotransferase [Candidatus Collierbacteria bacterium]|nr:DegT/DnrJ/EryC1/StrS family aminotransferase [Candidatus Collierbacteria bacterium]